MRQIIKRLCMKYAQRRPPNFIIGPIQRPYLLRWHIIPRNRFFNIYLHQILRSDDDRALHDHPWVNVSWILHGGYLEVLPFYQKQPALDDHLGRTHFVERREGNFLWRRPLTRHRLVTDGPGTTWTLFITGPVMRVWGFYTREGWVDWKTFTGRNSPC